MKKVLTSIAILSTLAFAVPAFADTTCSVLTPCGNGPIAAQQPGGRFLKPGQEDCPAWFPLTMGCYTMRASGVSYISLN